VFEGLVEGFGLDAPRVVSRDGQGDFIVIPNMPKRSRNVAYMALAGTRGHYETPLPRERPCSSQVLDEMLEDYSAATRDQITRTNVANLYSL
jgi:hypothetical protein